MFRLVFDFVMFSRKIARNSFRSELPVVTEKMVRMMVDVCDDDEGPSLDVYFNRNSLQTHLYDEERTRR